VNELTVRLALLFLPGIICALFVEKLVPTAAWSTARLALYALVLGLACYLTYALLDAVLARRWPPTVGLLKSLADNRSLDFTEIFLATAAAPFVGLAVSLALNGHWLNRLARAIHVSNKFGDLDVWALTFNSSDITGAWVVVREFDRDLAFEGWVDAFADTYDVNELLLRDVRVYQSSTSKFLYEVDSIYMTRPKDHLTIEFRR
jgi:MFS family permease